MLTAPGSVGSAAVGAGSRIGKIGGGMETAYDWVTVALFAVLAVTFLQRSIGPRPPGDRTLAYLPPALACAIANQLGNRGDDLAAVALILFAAGYTWWVIRPRLDGTPP